MKDIGEVWYINQPSLSRSGYEVRIKVVIVSVSFLNSSNPQLSDFPLHSVPFRVVIPILKWRNEFSVAIGKWMVEIQPSNSKGVTELSAVDVLQIRSIRDDKFVNNNPLGKLTQYEMLEIKKVLRGVLGL